MKPRRALPHEMDRKGVFSMIPCWGFLIVSIYSNIPPNPILIIKALLRSMRIFFARIASIYIVSSNAHKCMSKHLLPKVFSSRSHPTTTCIKKHLDRIGISFSVSVSVSVPSSPHTHVGTCMGTCMCLRVCACMDPLAARRKSDLKSSPNGVHPMFPGYRMLP